MAIRGQRLLAVRVEATWAPRSRRQLRGARFGGYAACFVIPVWRLEARDALRCRLIGVWRRARDLRAIVGAAREGTLGLRRVRAELGHEVLERVGNELRARVEGAESEGAELARGLADAQQHTASTLSRKALRSKRSPSCARTCAMSEKRASTGATSATNFAATSNCLTTSARGLPKSSRTCK